MLMSDLTHRSLACKAHLNMSIENALCKALATLFPGTKLGILGHQFYAQIWTQIRSKLHAQENARARLHPNKDIFKLKNPSAKPTLNASRSWALYIGPVLCGGEQLIGKFIWITILSRRLPQCKKYSLPESNRESLETYNLQNGL